MGESWGKAVRPVQRSERPMRRCRKRRTNDVPEVFWSKSQFGFEDQSKDFKLNAVRERKPMQLMYIY